VPQPLPSCRPFTEPYDRAELVADGVVHLVGIACAILGTALLVPKAVQLQALQGASVWIYGLCLVMLFIASAAYNFWPGIRGKLVLRRVDQSVIFLFIAATYTPLISLTNDEPSSIPLAAIWSTAWIGAVLKLGCPGRFERASIILCLILGWSGLVVYDDVFGRLPISSVVLIVAGGLLYSVGVIFHLRDGLRFQNAIWHLFVVTAAALQFWAIFDFLGVAAGRAS
jgi:hemolysin III